MDRIHYCLKKKLCWSQTDVNWNLGSIIHQFSHITQIAISLGVSICFFVRWVLGPAPEFQVKVWYKKQFKLLTSFSSTCGSFTWSLGDAGHRTSTLEWQQTDAQRGSNRRGFRMDLLSHYRLQRSCFLPSPCVFSDPQPPKSFLPFLPESPELRRLRVPAP